MTVAGGSLVVSGIIMLVIPGPGLLTIAGGLAIWATEYEWAARVMVRLKAWRGKTDKEKL